MTFDSKLLSGLTVLIAVVEAGTIEITGGNQCEVPRKAKLTCPRESPVLSASAAIPPTASTTLVSHGASATRAECGILSRERLKTATSCHEILYPGKVRGVARILRRTPVQTAQPAKAQLHQIGIDIGQPRGTARPRAAQLANRGQVPSPNRYSAAVVRCYFIAETGGIVRVRRSIVSLDLIRIANAIGSSVARGRRRCFGDPG